jgi:hypothetical protein
MTPSQATAAFPCPFHVPAFLADLPLPHHAQDLSRHELLALCRLCLLPEARVVNRLVPRIGPAARNAAGRDGHLRWRIRRHAALPLTASPRPAWCGCGGRHHACSCPPDAIAAR